MNRLEFLKRVGGGLAFCCVHPAFTQPPVYPVFSKSLFGEAFHWGVTTSAYQTEGAWNIDGKGESIWDRFSNSGGKIKDKTTGNVACDFYHRYQEDLGLLKNLNFKDFRFSLAWSRLLPDGQGKVNLKGLDFYNRVIDHCLSLGIEPWVTLYHWDLPQALEDRGGWTNRDILGWFSEYAELCAHHFGDRVKNWIVLNEPTAFTTLGYLAGIHAPGYRRLNKFLASVHYATLCQAEGGRIIRDNVSKAHVGTSFSCSFIEPYKTKPGHQRAAKRLDVMMNRLFIEPALGMGYPVADLPFLQKLDKFILPGDREKLIFDFDFIGLQNYFRVVAKPGIVPFVWANRVKPDKGKTALTEMGWEVLPESIYKIIKQFDRYPVREFVISENGAAFNDIVSHGRIHDIQRAQYFEEYLKQVLRAKNEGVNITGYFAWTLVDNFEWAEGVHPRFGIVYNDFATQQRLVKDSGFWFRDFLR